MGRRSLAAERKRQIIVALEQSIREFGYEGTTLEIIAEKAGVQRTLIRHYFGNRDKLLAFAVEQITEDYRRDYLKLADRFPANRKLDALLSYLFGGDFNRRPQDDAVIDVLIAASYQNDEAKKSLRRMYETFEEIVFDLLACAFPRASEKKTRQVAYALMCLAEQNAAMLGLGFGPGRNRSVRNSAEVLLASLALSAKLKKGE